MVCVVESGLWFCSAGVLTALQKCLLDGSDTLGSAQKAELTLPVADAILDLLERTSCLLLGVLYGDTAASAEEKGKLTRAVAQS